MCYIFSYGRYLMSRHPAIFFSFIMLLSSVLGCSSHGADRSPGKEAGGGSIVLATTTSTYNSGLLDVLNAEFTRRTGIGVKVIARGTGAALKLAANGDADVVMVHARDREDAFLAAGFGVNRRDLMYNDFVIVGPPEDPAEIKALPKASQALAKIAAFGAKFCSRNDESGTNIREMKLWRAAGIKPAGKWYLKVNKGMGATLIHADEIGGYTLCDRGTYLAYRFGRRDRSARLDLDILIQGDPALRNPYGIIAVNPARYAQAKYIRAMRYIAFLTSPAGQKLIGNFRVHGQVLFHPAWVCGR
jgi:tungstate transport system substrate-binding protein